jgi:hypothetical protein
VLRALLSPWMVEVTTCRTGPRSWMHPGSPRTWGLPPEVRLTSWNSEPLAKDHMGFGHCKPQLPALPWLGQKHFFHHGISTQ